LKHKGRELKSVTVKTEKNKNKRKILLLGSSHGREICPMLQENLGAKFDVCSIIKPNARLSKVVGDTGKLGKCLTEQDIIIIVGGPGNSLDRNCHYSIENDLNNIAERTSNKGVGFVNFFEGHDKPWMNGPVGSINLQLDWGLDEA
jgi:hypothetical protein